MKISIASDLHLEVQGVELTNKHDADVLVLAGDVMVADNVRHYPFNDNSLSNGSKNQENSRVYRRFFREVAERWKHIIYIAGNHEHYCGIYEYTDEIIRENLAHIGSNIHYLNMNTIQIDDVVFIGGTMWSDLNKRDPLTIFHIKDVMNDYRCIYTTESNSLRKLRPEDTTRLFDKTVEYIKRVASENLSKKVVVVTHHAPSYESISPNYRNDSLMSGPYASDLSGMILDNPNIKLWVHGHTHDDFDYMIGEHTRVVCNPRGYANYETKASNFDLKTIEI